MQFADKVGKREERIKALDTDALIEEFKDKKSGNVALIRKEMRERYKANKLFPPDKLTNRHEEGPGQAGRKVGSNREKGRMSVG